MHLRALKRLCEQHGLAKTSAAFSKALAEKRLDPYSIRLPELTRVFLGETYYDAERRLKAVMHGQAHLLEAAEAVDASAFIDITGQLLVTVIKEKYQAPEFIGSQLVRTIPNPGGNLGTHKVPYLSDADSFPQKLEQLQPYPYAKFQPQYVTLPAPEKFGQTCLVAFEMFFSDLTGQAQDSAASIGRAMGYLKEQRILRMVLGVSNPYVFNGNSMNTYLTTADANGKYVNRVINSQILNYTHVNNVEQLFYQMSDPVTGRKLMARPSKILLMPEKRYEMKRILNATETRTGNEASDTGNLVVAPNPLDTSYPLVWSPIARDIVLNELGLDAAHTKEYMVFADFQKAFVYREVYPMKVDQAPPQNPYEFQQDVVLAVKVSEFGVPGVYDPRYAALSTNEAS